MYKLPLNKVRLGIIVFIITTWFSISQAQSQVLIEFETNQSTVKEPVNDFIIHLIKIIVATDATLDNPIQIEIEPDFSSSSATFDDYEIVEDKIVLNNTIRSGYILGGL